MNHYYQWYRNKLNELDWEGDTQDLYHQEQLDQLQQQMESKMQTKYEQKPGTIAVFKADKEGNDKRPDWTGNMKTPDGTELQVSLWISESQKGLTYLNGQVQAPYGKEPDAVPF